ncbi:hypothetical protein E4T56_gene20936, partial [Termitomyces sp. T112]
MNPVAAYNAAELAVGGVEVGAVALVAPLEPPGDLQRVGTLPLRAGELVAVRGRHIDMEALVVEDANTVLQHGRGSSEAFVLQRGTYHLTNCKRRHLAALR